MCNNCGTKEDELIHLCRENARLITENHHLTNEKRALENTNTQLRKMLEAAYAAIHQ